MIEYNDERHEYKIRGIVVPSVTQVIAPLSPDFLYVDADVLERASNFGRAVHLACEQDDNDELDDEALDAPLLPYLAAWRLFKTQCEVVVLENERIVASDVLRVAGRLDRIAEIQGRCAVIDIKTCTTLSRVTGVQLAGYEELARHSCVLGNKLKVRRFAVQLKGDCTYQLKEYKNRDDVTAFAACTQLFHWSQNNAN